MRSFIIYLNFVSLLAVCLFACNHHSSNPMLQQVDSLLEMKPDSALTILKNISVLEDLPEVDKAYYALLLAEATDKNKLPLLPCDSLLNFALDYYGDDDREKAVALMYKGRLLAEMDDEKAAIEMNLKALEILQDNLAMNVQLDKEKHMENAKAQEQTEPEMAEAERVEAEIVYAPMVAEPQEYQYNADAFEARKTSEGKQEKAGKALPKVSEDKVR